jgi:epoxyqueuosine reductase
MKNSNLAANALIAEIDKIAAAYGLIFVGISDLDMHLEAIRFNEWIAEGRQAGMDWMEKYPDIRAKPDRLLEGAKSALIFAFPYFLGDRWSRGKLEPRPKVAQYARLRDYHKFLRSKLTGAQQGLADLLGSDHRFRIAIDSAPVLERALAAKTGSMFIGKNTCAIDPKRGSFFLLGEILTTWFDPQLAKSEPSTHSERKDSGGCGTCRRCQVHCPTGALDKDYQIDARKCLSYWTIENRGEIPTEYWPWIARYIFGCDICQLVCPYNRGITTSEESKSLLKIEDFDLFEVATMDQEKYEIIFGGTPMTRAKRSGLRRNAIIAAVVRGESKTIQILDVLMTDDDPIVSATAKTAKFFIKNNKNS